MNFDLDKFIDRSARLEIDDIDFDAFRDQPLSADSLRSLRYMHDIEFHTVCYLRDLLVTRVHADDDITAFLTFWNFEEYWHGDAIARVLHVHGEPSGASRIEELRSRLGRRDRLKPLVSMVGSALIKDFAAVHMTWGALNEWVAQASYGRLIKRSNHPELGLLLKRIMKQEGRHVDFYASQAKARLEGNRKAQLITRQLLKRKWAPVGAGVMPESEVRFLTSFLFGDPDGLAAADRIDKNLDRFPGLQGLGLVRRAVEQFDVRLPSADRAPIGAV
jgi:hypothetical protein